MSKSPLVLILGSVRRGEYETIIKNGYRLGVILDSNRHATLPSDKDFDWVLHHDFTRPLTALDPLLEKAREQFDITAIINLREFYVRAQSYAARFFSLPGLPDYAVEHVLNKTLMRKIFARSLGEAATPRFKEISSIDEAIAFVQTIKFPVILKPNNLYGSLFVRTVHDEENLRLEFANIQNQVLDHMGSLGVISSLRETIQIEEFLSGTVHSVECLIDGEKNVYTSPVVDVVTGKEVGQNHFGHVSRKTDTYLTAATQREMKSVAEQAVRALELRDTAAHVEFIASQNGAKLLEIAARPGGHRNRVLEMTYGISFNHQYLRMLLGEKPDLESKHYYPFAIVTPYPPNEMTFRGVKHLDKITQLKSYLSHEIKAKPGAKIGPAQGGYMSSWLVELGHTDRDVVHSDMQWLSHFPDFF